MPRKCDDDILIGIDGGATKVEAHQVIVSGSDGELTYELSGICARCVYPSDDSFILAGASLQLEEERLGSIRPTDAERYRGRSIIESIASCIEIIMTEVGATRVRLGIGMPGRKTADQRGIAVMINGPRMPTLVQQLEARLASAGVALVEPIVRIGSDGDYCGMGEDVSAKGLLRGVENAYYVGGGTGLAEALKLHARLVPFDEATHWIAKAWQMRTSAGSTYDQRCSMKGINAVFHELRGQALDAGSTPTPDDGGLFPEQEALAGDGGARQVLEMAAHRLAELVAERIETIYQGRHVLQWHNETYGQLAESHAYHGILLDRVVIGLHLGRIYDDRAYADVFRVPFDRRLAKCIDAFGVDAMRRHCLCGSGLRSGFVVGSRLLAAASLGAAIDAMGHPQCC